MCRVLREGPVLCLNQCVFGVDMRSNVSAMCFLVGFVCALVFKVLWHVVISYFRTSMETFMCRKHVCVGVKKFVTLKVHLFHEDQKVYKCRHTLVLLGLRVDYTADRFNSLALTDITADTLIALRRQRFIYLQEHYCVGIRIVLQQSSKKWASFRDGGPHRVTSSNIHQIKAKSLPN